MFRHVVHSPVEFVNNRKRHLRQSELFEIGGFVEVASDAEVGKNSFSKRFPSDSVSRRTGQFPIANRIKGEKMDELCSAEEQSKLNSEHAKPELQNNGKAIEVANLNSGLDVHDDWIKNSVEDQGREYGSNWAAMVASPAEILQLMDASEDPVVRDSLNNENYWDEKENDDSPLDQLVKIIKDAESHDIDRAQFADSPNSLQDLLMARPEFLRGFLAGATEAINKTRSFSPQDFMKRFGIDKDLFETCCQLADDLGVKLLNWDDGTPRIWWSDFEAFTAACQKEGMQFGGIEDHAISEW